MGIPILVRRHQYIESGPGRQGGSEVMRQETEFATSEFTSLSILQSKIMSILFRRLIFVNHSQRQYIENLIIYTG